MGEGVDITIEKNLGRTDVIMPVAMMVQAPVAMMSMEEENRQQKRRESTKWARIQT